MKDPLGARGCNSGSGDASCVMDGFIVTPRGVKLNNAVKLNQCTPVKHIPFPPRVMKLPQARAAPSRAAGLDTYLSGFFVLVETVHCVPWHQIAFNRTSVFGRFQLGPTSKPNSGHKNFDNNPEKGLLTLLLSIDCFIKRACLFFRAVVETKKGQREQHK